jgi:hypothetical protein
LNYSANNNQTKNSPKRRKILTKNVRAKKNPPSQISDNFPDEEFSASDIFLVKNYPAKHYFSEKKTGKESSGRKKIRFHEKYFQRNIIPAKNIPAKNYPTKNHPSEELS